MSSSFSSSLSFLNMTPSASTYLSAGLRPPIPAGATNSLIGQSSLKQQHHSQIVPPNHTPVLPTTTTTTTTTYNMQSSSSTYKQQYSNRPEITSKDINQNMNPSPILLPASQTTQLSQIPSAGMTALQQKYMNSSTGSSSYVQPAPNSELKGFTQVLNVSQSMNGSKQDINKNIIKNNENSTTNYTNNSNISQCITRKTMKRCHSTIVGSGSNNSISEQTLSFISSASSVAAVDSLQQQLPKQPAINGIARSPRRHATTKVATMTHLVVPSEQSMNSGTSAGSSLADLVLANQKKPPIVFNPYTIKTMQVLSDIQKKSGTISSKGSETSEINNNNANHPHFSLYQQQLDRLNPRMSSSSSSSISSNNNNSFLNQPNQQTSLKMPRINGLARSKSRNPTVTILPSMASSSATITTLPAMDSPLLNRSTAGVEDTVKGNLVPMTESVPVLKQSVAGSVRGSVVVRAAKMPSSTFFVDDPDESRSNLKPDQNTQIGCPLDEHSVQGGQEFLSNLFGKLHAIDEQSSHEVGERETLGIFAAGPVAKPAECTAAPTWSAQPIAAGEKEPLVKTNSSNDSESEFRYVYRQNSKSPSKLGRQSPMKNASGAAVSDFSSVIKSNSVIHAQKVVEDSGSFGQAMEKLYSTPSFVLLKDTAVSTAAQPSSHSYVWKEKESPLGSPLPILGGDTQAKQLLRSYSDATTEHSTEMDSPDSALTSLNSFPSDPLQSKKEHHKASNEFALNMLPTALPVPFLRISPTLNYSGTKIL